DWSSDVCSSDLGQYHGSTGQKFRCLFLVGKLDDPMYRFLNSDSKRPRRQMRTLLCRSALHLAVPVRHRREMTRIPFQQPERIGWMRDTLRRTAWLRILLGSAADVALVTPRCPTFTLNRASPHFIPETTEPAEWS